MSRHWRAQCRSALGHFELSSLGFWGQKSVTVNLFTSILPLVCFIAKIIVMDQKTRLVRSTALQSLKSMALSTMVVECALINYLFVYSFIYVTILVSMVPYHLK